MLVRVLELIEVSEKLRNSVSANLSTNFEILSFLTSNGDLFICELSSSIPTPYVICKNAVWHLVQEENSSASGCVLLVGTASGSWNLYKCSFPSVSGKGVDVTLQHTWDEKSISSLRYSLTSALDNGEEICEKDVSVLALRRNRAIICLQNQIICSVDTYLDRFLDTRSIFRISDENSPARIVKLADKFLCVLEHSGCTVSLYDVEKGMKTFCLRLPHFNIPEAIDVHVSYNSSRILIVDNRNQLYCLKVDRDTRGRDSKPRKPALVTAFSKQLSSKLTKSQVPDVPLCQKLPVSGCLTQAVVEDGCVFLCLRSHDARIAFQVINFQNTVEINEQLEDANPLLLKPAGRCCPPLLIACSNLYLPSVGLPETDFVKKLMLHSSGSLAEQISLLNNWVDVMLDKDILVMGIRNRQLDTIGFFLAQKSKDFSKSLSSSSLREESLKRWVEILQLIQQTVIESTNDNASLLFAEQLLQMTFKTLVELLALADPTRTSEVFERASTTFTKFLIAFRGLLKGRKSSSFIQEVAIPEVTFTNDFCIRWEAMDKESVIEEAVLKGLVPLAQWALSQRPTGEVVPLQSFQEMAKPLAHQALVRGDIREALGAISNTGLPVDRTVQELFESTTVNRVRTILGEHLSRRNQLQFRDQNDLQYLSFLEILYPCTDFSTARQHALDNRPDVGGGLPIPPLDLLPTSDLLPSFVGPENLDSFRYGQFSLAWIRHWDAQTRQKVLVPALLRGEVIPEEFRPSKEMVWECLLERGDVDHLQHWVACFVEQRKEAEVVLEFPFGWPIDATMINKITEVTTPQHVRDFLLNDLARHGFFCNEELEDIQSLLCRLGSAGVLRGGPHLPVQRKSQGSTISMRQSDYNHRLVHYCLKNHLTNLLYYFVRNNGSALQFSDCAWCRVPLVTTAQIFCQWENDPQDPYVCYQAVVNSAQMVHCLKEASILSCCQEASVPSSLVAATLLYCPQTIRSSLLSHQRDKETIESAVDDVPFMRSALALANLQPQQDVNVYNLLLDNCVFDPRRLFGWQITNTIKTEEAPSEIPHFSQEYWVQQYGLRQSLDTAYYLLEGRPNYAFLKFLSKELCTLKTIDPHRVKKACLDACILALRHYTSFKVGSACILFLQLLGQDSFSLRMHLQVAAALHPTHLERPSPQNVALLESALKNPESAQEAGEALDKLCCRLWCQTGGNDSVLPVCFLLVSFCHHYQLNIIPGFLKLMAKSSDWLSLLSFAQVLNIPVEQVLSLIKEIPDTCLVDHLINALQSCTVQSQAVKPKVSREPKDMRTMLYSRLKLLEADKSQSSTRSHKQVEEDQLSLSSDDGSCSDSSGSIKEVPDMILQPRDLIEQLLSACNSSTPGVELLDASIINGNPHLCLIAASLTETVTLYQSFCCWLVSSLDDPCTVLTTELVSSAKDWTLQSLSQVLMLLVQHRKFKILERAFWLFDPYSSLFRLTDFLHSFWTKKEFRASIELLEKFQAIQATSPVGKIGTLEWVVSTCIGMIRASLISASNAFEQKLFLEVLSQARLTEIFSHVEGVLDFGHLHQLLECIPAVDLGSVSLPISNLIESNQVIVDQAVMDIVSQLQSLGRTKEAKRLGQLAEIPSSVVLLSQLSEEAKALQAKDVEERKAFWKECSVALMKEEDIQDQALCFFKIWSRKASSVEEQYTILALVNEWFHEPSEEQEEWEQAMWHSCVDCEIERQKKSLNSEAYICETRKSNDQSWETWDLDCFQQNDGIRPAVKSAVENITTVLLDRGRIGDALKLAKIHHHFTDDLNALVMCLKIARSQILPDAISSDFWDSFFLRNVSSDVEAKRSAITEASKAKNMLFVMEKMCELIVCGKKIAYQILNHYKASQLLECDYESVAKEQSPLDLLDRVLNCKSPEKYKLAKEVLSVHRVADQEVVEYLYRRISLALVNVHSPLPTLEAYKVRSRSVSMLSWPAEQSVQFQLLLRLCQDPAQLGHKLLDTVRQDKSTIDGNNLPWKVSILVYSHECFTACMHMEGISKLLRQARKLALELAQAQAFHQMVKLLTGIGRYSDMTYIFDLLRENAQFELLLKKGMEEQPMLKLALLHYLKKHHMNDREIHSMLALKFKMFREVAEMLEKASQEKIAKLMPLTQDVKELRHELEIVMQDYEAATKSYIEASCLLRAQNCARQAQLVAVQLNLLASPGPTWILSLTQEKAKKFVVSHKHFLQAYLVCEAYELSSSAGHDPWEQALQVQVLERGDWEYFDQFKAHLGLTDARIQGLAQKLLPDSNREVQKRMQRLLSECRDVTVRYTLAERLGFSDMCKDLLQSETTGAYLKDTLQGLK